MKKLPPTARTGLRLLFAACLIGWLVKQAHVGNIVNALAQGWAHRGWLTMGALLAWAGLCVGAVRWHLILRKQKTQIGLFASIRLFFIGQFFNAFMPGGCGGDLARAVLVAREAHTHRAEAATSVFIDRFFGLVITVLFCVVMIALRARWFLAHRETHVAGILMLGFMACAILGLAALLTGLRSRFFQGLRERLQRRRLGLLLDKALEAIRLFHRDGPLMSRTALLSLVNLALLTYSGACLGASLELPVNSMDYFTLLPILTILTAIPLTPGALGQREGLFVVLFGALGVVPADAIALALLVYAGAGLWSLAGGLLFLGYKPAERRALVKAMEDGRERAAG